MKKSILYFTLIVFVCLAFAGCRKDEYEQLNEKKTELEGEWEQLDTEKEDLEQEIETINADIDELNEDNKALFEDTLIPNNYFYITAEEYLETINMVQEDPMQLWENGDEIKLVDNLEFEETKENFITKYTCKVFSNKTTGEKMTVEIEALETGNIKKITIVYNYPDDGTSSELGYVYYYNYTDIFMSSFIMTNREVYSTDDVFGYLYERFYGYGTYYEGNVWAYDYFSEDETTFTLEFLPIGLEE